MGDYLRATRECTLRTLNPLLATTIRAHIEKCELEDIETSTLMCCETTATKQKKRLFGGKKEVIVTGVILTPQWLIWASEKENKNLGVLSARLRDIRVQDYEKTSMFEMMQDTGLNISGLRTDTGPGSTFIGLGPEPAAQKFRAMLKEAISEA